MVEKEKIQGVPEGWIETPLSNVAESKKFAIVDGPFGTQLHADEYSEEGVPVVRIANLSFQGAFNNEDIKFISERKADILKRSAVVPGDIIIAKTGATIGKTALFPNDYNRGIIASSCLKISFKKEKASSKFFLYLLVSPRGQKNIIDGAGGSTRTTINIKPFSSIKFTIPESFSEQSKIASILSTCDEAIEKTDAKIEKLKRIKQGLMQDLFRYGIDENGKMRSEATHHFKNSPLGRIPEEWEVKTLNDVVNYVGSGVTPTGGEAVYQKEGIKFVRSQNVTFRGIFEEDLAYISESIHKRMQRSEIYSFDILLNITGASIGRCCVVPEYFGKANVNQHVCAIRLLERDLWLSSFVSYFLQAHLGQKQIDILNAGGNREGLNYQQIRAFNIYWPKKPEQSRIASILFSADAAIEKEDAYKNKLLALKRGLMDDLLSGKVRVNKLIKEAA